LKDVREKNQITYKGKPIKITADISPETLKQEGYGVRYFKHLKKTILALGYSTQKNYYSKLTEK
jgi:hypothetical protein